VQCDLLEQYCRNTVSYQLFKCQRKLINDLNANVLVFESQYTLLMCIQAMFTREFHPCVLFTKRTRSRLLRFAYESLNDVRVIYSLFKNIYTQLHY